MLTIGVDLAAEPKGTAVAGIEWGDGRAKLVNLMLGATDGYIVEASSSAGKIGIDCALGWPDRFVDFVVNHRAFNHEVNREFGAMDWRKDLSYRETDRRVRELTGRWPLSVATDRLGVTALRCAGLMERLGAAGVDVDRAGFGGVVEVYPAGSLKNWRFDTAGRRITTESVPGFTTIRSVCSLAAARATRWGSIGMGRASAFQFFMAAADVKTGITFSPPGPATVTTESSWILSSINYRNRRF